MKHTPAVFISKEMVQQLNEKHGWFEFRDAQSDVSNAFANEAIERYERIRAAAPDLLAACQEFSKLYGKLWDVVEPSGAGMLFPEAVAAYDEIHRRMESAIAKAVQA